MKPALSPILWVTPKWPLPDYDGARKATCSLLRGLGALGVPIDLLAIEPEESDPSRSSTDAIQELRVRSASVIRRPPCEKGALRALQLASLMVRPRPRSVTLAPFSAPSTQVQLRAILKTRKYRTVVFDGLHGAAAHSVRGHFLPVPGAQQTIYRAHNVEASLWSQSRGRFGAVLAPLMKAQAERIYEFETSLIRNSDWVTPVSDEDLNEFRTNNPEIRGKVIPIGMTIPRAEPIPPGNKLELLFIGRLDWPPNSDGLAWFLREIWPTISQLRPDLWLRVAGSGDPGALRKLFTLPRLRWDGPVTDPAPLYRSATVSLVPVFVGSGVRVKAIESALHARASIGTSLGMQGTGLVPDESYFRCETAAEWIAQLSQMTRESATRIGAAARRHAEVRFDPTRIATDFAALLRG